MPRLNPIALSVIWALSIAGCAMPLQKQADQPAVQPVLAVKHGVTGEAMYRLGRYFEGQARYEKAIAAYREALKRDPLLVEAYTGLGMALAAQRRYDEAIRQFQAAVVLAPHVAYLHNNLGYAYLLSGAAEDAMKALEEARRLDPAHERSRENLRIAQASVAAATAQPAGANPGPSLVEVAPQVFELRAPTRYRKVAPASSPVRRFKLEVSNGNGVDGLAKRISGRLASAGVRTARLTNQRPFKQARTELQYRAGYAAEAAELAGKLEHPARLVPRNDLAKGVDVRLVLGRDLPLQALERSSRRPGA